MSHRAVLSFSPCDSHKRWPAGNALTIVQPQFTLTCACRPQRVVRPCLRGTQYSPCLPCLRTHAREGQQFQQWRSKAGYLLRGEHVQFSIDLMFHLFNPSPAWNGVVHFSPPLVPQVCLKHIDLLGLRHTSAVCRALQLREATHCNAVIICCISYSTPRRLYLSVLQRSVAQLVQRAGVLRHRCLR